MNRLCGLLLVVSGLVSQSAVAQDAADGHASPGALVKTVHTALQVCDMRRVASYVTPAAKVPSIADIQRAVESCKNGEMRDELTAYGIALGMEPKLSNDGTVATYNLKDAKLRRHELRLIKVAGKWYTANS